MERSITEPEENEGSSWRAFVMERMSAMHRANELQAAENKVQAAEIEELELMLKQDRELQLQRWPR